MLDTDASAFAMGGVLSQIEDGVERPIAYFSKVFSKPERNYCVTRRELLAVVSSIKHFYHYLYGKDFLVRTDHGALTWLLNFKNPEGQVARWLEVLLTYNFKIVHRPGKQHGNSDGLSRRPCSPCNNCDKKENNYKANEVDDNSVQSERRSHHKSKLVFVKDTRRPTEGAANRFNFSKNHQMEIRGPQTNLAGSRKRINIIENLLVTMESTNADK